MIITSIKYKRIIHLLSLANRKILSKKSMQYSSVESHSLSDVEASVADAISNNASLIYYHHGIKHFTYYIESDKKEFRVELRNVKNMIRTHVISSITAGETLDFAGTELFPMDLKIVDHPCYPYSLLRKRGLIDDAENTPYFFRSSEKRDEIITWLKK